MRPVLFNIGWLNFYSFGVMLALAFLAGLFITRREMARRKLDPDIAYDLLLAVAFGALIGARSFYVIGHWSDFYSKNPMSIFSVWEGGLVFYGGLLGAGLALYLMARYRKLPILRLADSVAAALALGSAIGRIGCFLQGCCYGVAAEPPFGLKFLGNGMTGTYLPTQLVEMTWGFITFAVLYFWIPKKLKLKTDGSLFVIYLGFYGLGRFLIEFVRTAPWRLFDIFTFSQLVSAALLIFAIVYIVARRRAGKL